LDREKHNIPHCKKTGQAEAGQARKQLSNSSKTVRAIFKNSYDTTNSKIGMDQNSGLTDSPVAKKRDLDEYEGRYKLSSDAYQILTIKKWKMII